MNKELKELKDQIQKQFSVTPSFMHIKRRKMASSTASRTILKLARKTELSMILILDAPMDSLGQRPKHKGHHPVVEPAEA